jgi:HAD superfamily phosphatase (TIGR01668 family)
MSFSPIPRYLFRSLTDISPEFLKKLGVRFLMLDLDNTVAAYSERSPSNNVALWSERAKECGIKLYIVSNSVHNKRVEAFAKALHIGFVMDASKPSPKIVLRTMEEYRYNLNESALVGDQIFTDTLAANRAGIMSIIVRPCRFTNPLLAIRYALEMPFRAMCRNKNLVSENWNV